MRVEKLGPVGPKKAAKRRSNEVKKQRQNEALRALLRFFFEPFFAVLGGALAFIGDDARS
jgi:hypothetical protein